MQESASPEASRPSPESSDGRAKLPKPHFAVGERLVRAFTLAVELHSRQARKQRGIPYISHLMDVSALVMQYGGSEDQAIAALLHDGPEDNGGRATLERITREFGSHVARMVQDCSDSYEGEDDGLTWMERKQAQFNLFSADALFDSCLVYAADKISNTRTLTDFLRRSGHHAWKAFAGKPHRKVWYMREMAAIFRGRGTEPGMVEELDRCLDTLEQVMVEVERNG